jgi:hypothetical protein
VLKKSIFCFNFSGCRVFKSFSSQNCLSGVGVYSCFLPNGLSGCETKHFISIVLFLNSDSQILREKSQVQKNAIFIIYGVKVTLVIIPFVFSKVRFIFDKIGCQL